MSDERADVESICDAAMELPSSQAQTEFIRKATDGDEELTADVHELLRAKQARQSTQRNAAETVSMEPWGDAAGMQIGPYKLLGEIGAGGFGQVYQAEQREPVRRMVALKIIKRGMESKSVIARFEGERQALALMNHPYIAKVFDGGATADGCPYFAMELVKGVPLTSFCDANTLSISERLELFVKICMGVQHAHQKGVIHRDLKPSNVLVLREDGEPIPKVIDFGLAKALTQRLTDKTMFTAHGQMVGTPHYMSPEQAASDNLDADTRSDVYSLGVILFELLTGSTPLEASRVKDMSYAELQQAIREEEPPRPSTRLDSQYESGIEVTQSRQTDAKKLAQVLRCELDWIVIKCLEKDRDRRYETAQSLANDVQRFLNGEMVSARPPTSGYRLRKFARKHRKTLTTAVAFLLLMIGGTTVSIWQAIRARTAEAAANQSATTATFERDEKERARQDAVAAADREKAAKLLAQDRLAQLDKATNILASVFSKLSPDDAAQGESLRVALGKQLDFATEELNGEAIGDPLTTARMQMILGTSQLNLGYTRKGISLLEKSRDTRKKLLGERDLNTFQTMSNLGWGYTIAGRIQDAISLLEETLRLQSEVLGENHEHVLVTANNLAQAYQGDGKSKQAISLFEKTLRQQTTHLGANHPDTVTTRNNLATAYQAVGEVHRAEPLLEKILQYRRTEWGERHPKTLTSMHNLASAYLESGELGKAVPLLEKTKTHRDSALGEDHPNTLATALNLAVAYKRQGHLSKAIPLYTQLLDVIRKKQGRKHPDALLIMNNLAVAYQANQQLDKALPLFEEMLETRKKTQTAGHPEISSAMYNLAMAYRAAGKTADAIPLLEEALKLTLVNPGERHPMVGDIYLVLVGSYWNLGRYQEAIRVGEAQLKRLDRLKTKNAKNDLQTILARNRLATIYKHEANYEKAVPLFQQAYQAAQHTLGDDSENTQTIAQNYAFTCLLAGKAAQAEPVLKELLEQQAEKHGQDHINVAAIAIKLGQCFIKLDRQDEAEPYLRNALRIGEKTIPESWFTSQAQVVLGECLTKQKKYTEAERLLLAGCEELQKRMTTIPMSQRKDILTNAMRQLIQLYRARSADGDDAKVSNWETKLKAIDQ